MARARSTDGTPLRGQSSSSELTRWAGRVARERLQAAIKTYVSRGWPICVAAYVTESGCSCGWTRCPSPGVHRLSAPSLDTEELEALVQSDPRVNLMIATGGAVNAVEVALPWGRVAAARLNGNGPVAAVGESYVFLVAGGPPLLVPGVNWYGAGGYVLVPPSVLPRGNAVHWVCGPGYPLPTIATMSHILGRT